MYPRNKKNGSLSIKWLRMMKLLPTSRSHQLLQLQDCLGVKQKIMMTGCSVVWYTGIIILTLSVTVNLEMSVVWRRVAGLEGTFLKGELGLPDLAGSSSSPQSPLAAEMPERSSRNQCCSRNMSRGEAGGVRLMAR